MTAMVDDAAQHHSSSTEVLKVEPMACAACVALHLNGDEKQVCERMRKFIKHLPGKVLGTASSS
jgi:hypothetical protein